MLHNLNGCKTRLLLANERLRGVQSALLVKLIGNLHGLTILDNVPAYLRAGELLLNRVACHDKILSVVYLDGNSYITPFGAACQVLKPTCKPIHKTYIIGELVRIINLDDRIPYLLRTAVRASPVPRPGGDAITFQLVK